jgi:ribonucleotide reductase beta subunit family protein with ferritin-like domain
MSESASTLQILVHGQDGQVISDQVVGQDVARSSHNQSDVQTRDDYFDLVWWNLSLERSKRSAPSQDVDSDSKRERSKHARIKPLSNDEFDATPTGWQQAADTPTRWQAAAVNKSMSKIANRAMSKTVSKAVSKAAVSKIAIVGSVPSQVPAHNQQLARDDVKHPQTIEPILIKSEKRFQLLPIQRPKVWKKVELTRSLAWKASQYTYDQDKIDFITKLTPAEQHLILIVECFFANSDLIVCENLVTNLITRVQSPEWRVLYIEQLAIENVHAETYSLQLNALVEDIKKRQTYFNAIETIPVVKAKDKWMIDNFEHNDNFAECILVGLCSEHIFFSSSFAVIYWFKSRNLLPGICNANEEIARDESMHVDSGCMMWNDELKYLPSVQRIHQLVKEAVNLECMFVHEALGRLDETQDITVESMCSYVKFMADRLCALIHVPAIYDIPDCPLVYMTNIGLQGKSNLHERVGNEYRRPT